VAWLSAVISGSDWRPERGDMILPLDPARPLFHYEHPFAPSEIEAEAVAAGLRVAHRCDYPNTPVIVFDVGG